jgi:hypothetical protein
MPINSGLIPRTLVQAIPSVTPFEFVGTLAIGGTRNVDFDALRLIADPNQLGAGVSPSPTAIIAVGPFLDAFLFADQDLTLNVFVAISGGTFRQLTSTLVGASTFENISGLRVTGRYARVQLVNNSGILANIELGAYLRST